MNRSIGRIAFAIEADCITQWHQSCCRRPENVARLDLVMELSPPIGEAVMNWGPSDAVVRSHAGVSCRPRLGKVQ